ncbi:DUF7269 family protein [Haloarchaeobius litoreus]|uniref:Uncharacterized protein n=1 Tax=Haloarchaeobius litoreus TaxID=755306 RepID=A0ABD6DNJ3_9EURY|nr:hypothetical protein [Haloarchaeobius litoreus]
MKLRRAGLGLVGIAAIAGFLLTGGNIASLLPVDAAVELLGNDYLVVAAVAATGFALALLLVLSGRPGNVDEVTTPDPERAISLPVPGDDFDDAMGSRLALLPLVGGTDRAGIRERLHSDVVHWLMRSENCSRTEAELRVATGDWTDDRDAALFLADRPSRRARASAILRSWLRLRPWVQVGAHRTARALVDASEEVGPTAARPADSGPADRRQSGVSRS